MEEGLGSLVLMLVFIVLPLVVLVAGGLAGIGFIVMFAMVLLFSFGILIASSLAG